MTLKTKIEEPQFYLFLNLNYLLLGFKLHFHNQCGCHIISLDEIQNNETSAPHPQKGSLFCQVQAFNFRVNSYLFLSNHIIGTSNEYAGSVPKRNKKHSPSRNHLGTSLIQWLATFLEDLTLVLAVNSHKEYHLAYQKPKAITIEL